MPGRNLPSLSRSLFDIEVSVVILCYVIPGQVLLYVLWLYLNWRLGGLIALSPDDDNSGYGGAVKKFISGYATLAWMNVLSPVTNMCLDRIL